jgi:hypothetical protein
MRALGRSARVSLFAAIVLACPLVSRAAAQSPPADGFTGLFSGSYRIPENDLDVRVSIAMIPVEGRIKIRWIETVTNGRQPTVTTTYDFLGLVRGAQLRFSTPAKSLFPGLTYTAVRVGADLLLHLKLFAHPTGVFVDQACEACEDVVREVRMVRRP